MGYETRWVGAVYFTKGRDAPVRRIVLHWMATTLAGCDATFTGGQREASAHYGLEGDKRHQYVREADTAWHSGVRSVNHESIGIEHSAQPGRDATEATIRNSVELCTVLCRRYGLTADAIDKHNDFSATQCPGTLPVSRIREAVRANLAGTTAPSTPVPQEDPDMMLSDKVTLSLFDAAGKATGETEEQTIATLFNRLNFVYGEVLRQRVTEAAQTAALKAIAEAQGVDAEAVTAHVLAAVDKALANVTLTLTTGATP